MDEVAAPTEQPIRLTLGKVEALLSTMHGIADAKRTAFHARLKNFNRLGYPLGLERSQGKTALYSPGLAVEMALAIEMTQLGVLPERLVKVLTLNRFPTFSAIRMSTSALLERPQGFDAEQVRHEDPFSMFLFFDPAALSVLMVDEHDDEGEVEIVDRNFFYGGERTVRDNIVKWTSGQLNRLSFINVTSMIDMLADVACPASRRGAEDLLAFKRAFFREVQEWADARYDETYEHDADWFMMRLIERTVLAPPDSADIEPLIASLIIESGLKPETIQLGLSRFMANTPVPLGQEDDDGDR